MTVDAKNPTYTIGATKNYPETPTGVRVDRVGISKKVQADVLFASFLATAAGNNTIITNIGTSKIRVLGYHLVAGTGGDSARWEDSAGANLTGGAGAGGRFLLVASQALAVYSQVGVFETAAGEDLILNLATGNDVPGVVTYCYVPA